MTFETLIGCVAERWIPRIGDPNLTGWLTVADYLLCAVLALAVAVRLDRRAGRGFWGLIAATMLLLAINKQLDLQSALTAAGRCLAKVQGWYGNRRAVQAAFIAALVLAAVGGLVMGARVVRGRLLTHGAALAGLTLLVGFVLVRAVGFHHIDHLLGLPVLGATANFLFENAGLVLIALNAAAILLWGDPRRRTAAG